MKKRILFPNLITVVFALVCLVNVFVPVLAAETTSVSKQTEVLFICKVNEEFETDDYSPLVVKLLNEDTGVSSTYKLYNYNNFSERYLIDNGRYSIIYAYITGRSDVVFDVVSDPIYEIGQNNTIYFELNNTGLLGSGKKETTSATERPSTTIIAETPTEGTEIQTLFPILTTKESESEANGSTTKETELTTEEYTTEQYTETSEEQTSSLLKQDTFQAKMAKIFIVSAITILILIITLAIIYTKKKEE